MEGCLILFSETVITDFIFLDFSIFFFCVTKAQEAIQCMLVLWNLFNTKHSGENFQQVTFEMFSYLSQIKGFDNSCKSSPTICMKCQIMFSGKKKKKTKKNITILSSAELAKSKPALVAQLDAPSDWRPGGRGFNPLPGLSRRLIMKYFLWSFSPFRWFKKGSCQFLAKECAQYWLIA